ncbi:cold shock domain-containing protein [Sandaracinobacteroides sp. A072]|uniref:cold shock domain-containing protein n=1 Tax=Sandaracinobacteroides sp. A072 TaxID=3461146 RepID=UPI00404149BC
MALGVILWFDEARGFGFIRPDMGPKDVFLHVSALAEAGLGQIAAGTRVEFELVQTGDGRLTAQRVLPLAPARQESRNPEARTPEARPPEKRRSSSSRRASGRATGGQRRRARRS